MQKRNHGENPRASKNQKVIESLTLDWFRSKCSVYVRKSNQMINTVAQGVLGHSRSLSWIRCSDPQGSDWTKWNNCTSVRQTTSKQGRIQPVSLGGAISVKFGSQVLLWVHYCKTDEIYFTTLLWHKNGRQNGPISQMLFSELCKILVNKVTFVGFRGTIAPIAPPPLDPPLPQKHLCSVLYWVKILCFVPTACQCTSYACHLWNKCTL